MTKAYSNKALPVGTILREWRLEQVLGVGGFGIVYRGRGIYFDELVAIKEYFPSSISEREEDDTVVPIDSNAEEVHALGLKKFVEEAKLLWNLSTPTRHPNIVSVRSLFEVHGTAYMVMDFEDGISLSRRLKEGRRFNEESLSALIFPIAEGLERAHRVGVLHRDIKPPNILINDDGRPVLIDFGSARFESGDATSTKVTFHTPPYAAIEQYVRTYQQGPWTDIYALGVVLYECVTGKKPAEVLERMHGDAGAPLASESWPGYSRPFLAAIDVAMRVRPGDRPQSISAWLDLFRGKADAGDLDGEATRISSFDQDAAKISPIEPAVAGQAMAGAALPTGVPDDPHAVEFKGPGHESVARRIDPPRPTVAPVDPPRPAAAPVERTPGEAIAQVAAAPTKPVEKEAAPKRPAAAERRAGASAKWAVAAAAGIAVIGAGAYMLAGRSGSNSEDALVINDIPPDSAAVDAGAVAGLLGALNTLTGEARQERLVDDAIVPLTEAKAQIDAMAGEASNPAVAQEMNRIARKAGMDFSAVLVREADDQATRLAAQAPWANPASADIDLSLDAERRSIAIQARDSMAALRQAAARTGTAGDGMAALNAAREALSRMRSLKAAIAAAQASGGRPAAPVKVAEAPRPKAQTAAPLPQAAADAPVAAATASAGVGAGTRSTIEALIGEARSLCNDAARMGKGRRPGSSASAAEQEGYRIRYENAAQARGYLGYLSTLGASLRGAGSDAEAAKLLASAKQTRAYCVFLQKRSAGAR